MQLSLTDQQCPDNLSRRTTIWLKLDGQLFIQSHKSFHPNPSTQSQRVCGDVVWNDRTNIHVYTTVSYRPIMTDSLFRHITIWIIIHCEMHGNDRWLFLISNSSDFKDLIHVWVEETPVYGSMELGQIQVVWESDCNVTFARCSCCVCVKSFGDVVRSAWGEKHQGENEF